MRLLLDTHAFLWAAGEPSKLSRKARSAIEDATNDVFVSAAVAWEIAVKHALGKLSLPLNPETYVPARLVLLGFTALSISIDHALAAGRLPQHHRDPFDRIMIAQAQIEGLTLVTHDPVVSRYRVKTLASSSSCR